ncbi:hypothetical protein [Ferrovibrio sp.]|jgi:hypothetical protein|uniref:hypothetical protein n=1 Tax=Ferrovibrio sp. TaxID=1917215 RepID=UPI0035B2F588
MQIRSFTALAVAVLLSVLALVPAHAQSEKVKFQGWMWNQSGGVLTVQRVATQCWDPQQLAYQQIQPNALWSFATESDRFFNCYTAFISANVFDQNNTLLFWFQIFDDFVSQTCYIYLFSPGGTNIFNMLPPTGCANHDTISYTMYVGGGNPPAAIVAGLKPLP